MRWTRHLHADTFSSTGTVEEYVTRYNDTMRRISGGWGYAQDKKKKPENNSKRLKKKSTINLLF